MRCKSTFLARWAILARFLTRFLTSLQWMAAQFSSGFPAPMSLQTRSFTGNSVPLRWFIVDDLLEICRLSTRGKVRTPISRITRSFRFLQHPLPTGYLCIPYGLPTLTLKPENPLGFCSSQCLRCVRVGFRLYSDGIAICPSTE